MRSESRRRPSLATLIATGALLCAAGAMVFAMVGNAIGGGKPKLMVSEVSGEERNVDGGATLVKVLECPAGSRAISSSHDIFGSDHFSSHVGLIFEDERRTQREWASTFGVLGDGPSGIDWNMHVYCARVR